MVLLVVGVTPSNGTGLKFGMPECDVGVNFLDADAQ
jgi:hypothetical protein